MIQIIAELGLNHNGDVDTACRMINEARIAGCTGVKAQNSRAEDFLPEGHPDWDMFKSNESWMFLQDMCDSAHYYGLSFGTTPTSIDGVHEAVEAGVDFLKNGSDFLLRVDMIDAMLKTRLPTWVSTGMAAWPEVERVPVAAHLMVCTSLYPCPDENLNLRKLKHTIQFSRRIEGFSDHSEGTFAATVAAALGATMIEKHFTLDKASVGPDHHFSADPDEMAALVRDVRRVETVLGRHAYPDPAEAGNREKWRVTAAKLRA